MKSPFDRFTFWTLRSAGVALVIGGASALMAGVPAATMLPGLPIVRTITGIGLQISFVFIAGGAFVIYLSRMRGPLLPNERHTVSDAREPLGGWLIALAVALVALPVWTAVRVQPLLEGWIQVVDYLGTWDWDGANASGSGLALLPLAGALTPPALQLAAAVFVVAASAMLLATLLLRSPSFPRLYVVCAALSAALVFAGVRSARAGALAGDALMQLIQDTGGNAEETAGLTEGVRRYTGIIGSTAPVLMWALCAYLVWIPPLLFSTRSMVTFARSSAARAKRPAAAADLEAITSPPA